MLFVHNLLSWLGHLFLICMKIEFVINFMTPKKTVVHLKLKIQKWVNGNCVLCL